MFLKHAMCVALRPARLQLCLGTRSLLNKQPFGPVLPGGCRPQPLHPAATIHSAWQTWGIA